MDWNEGSRSYWISPVRAQGDRSVEEILHELLAARGIFALGARAPARLRIVPGDHICFYSAGIGVVGDARVTSKPQMKGGNLGAGLQGFPWVFEVEGVRLYLDTPIALDARMRSQLDALRGRENRSWSWLVHTTTELSEHDFELVTHKSGIGRQLGPN